MDWNSFVGPAVVAAIVSGAISAFGIWVGRTTNIRVNDDKIRADSELARKRFEFDRDISERKFSYERQQAVFKRRFELAEQVLADAYKFRHLMAYVRSGVSFGSEGSTRKAAEFEDDGLKRTLDGYFVPVERLQKESEFTSSMMAKRYAFAAHFGKDSNLAFDTFNQSMHAVNVASSMLISLAGQNRRENRDLVEQLESDIWEPKAKFSARNDIGKNVDEAIARIELLCQPVLEEFSETTQK